MLMLTYVDSENTMKGKHIDCISWTPDASGFIIRDRNELVEKLLPLFFREGKFSSFTRKLYRWGFRQICIPKGQKKKDRDLIFGHEHFKRDNKALITNMRSLTAAGTRRALAALAYNKKAKEQRRLHELADVDSRERTPSPAVSSITTDTPEASPRTATSEKISPRPIPLASTNLQALSLPNLNPLRLNPLDDGIRALQNTASLQTQINFLKALSQSSTVSQASVLPPPNLNLMGLLPLIELQQQVIENAKKQAEQKMVTQVPSSLKR